MKTIYARLILVSLPTLLLADTLEKELQKEFAKLQQLRQEIERKIAYNKKILTQIQQATQELKDLNQTINQQIEQIKNERFKKLAKDFESMDPEYAGEKLSKMSDPAIAAYILFNMNPRKAGEALNYVDPKMLDKITSILTKLKKNAKKK